MSLALRAPVGESLLCRLQRAESFEHLWKHGADLRSMVLFCSDPVFTDPLESVLGDYTLNVEVSLDLCVLSQADLTTETTEMGEKGAGGLVSRRNHVFEAKAIRPTPQSFGKRKCIFS